MSYRHLPMNQLPKSEQPYEKCEQQGPAALSDAELLSVIIKTGTQNIRALDLAHQLLAADDAQPGLEGLLHFNMNSLMKIKGIGKVKAVQILCLVELSRRIARIPPKNRIQFSNPESVAGYYMEDMRYYKQEHLLMIMLNTKNNMIKELLVTKGSINATIIEPRDIFIAALAHEAVKIILIHNHPSGDPTPSDDDLLMTRRIARAGTLIGIELADHIIIGDKCFESLHLKGIL